MRFSIITITKDDPKGFLKTKLSVEKQVFKDFEWIVIDGNIEPDHGIYDAMNKGLNRAQGDYVVFMNGGDYFADDNSLGVIAKQNADFMYGDAIEDGFIKTAKHHTKIHTGMITHHQAMIYKRYVIGDLRFDQHYAVASDYKFTIEFLNKAKDVAYIPHPLCIFTSGGFSQKNARQARLEERAIRKEMGITNSVLTPMRQLCARVVRYSSPSFYFILRDRLWARKI